ncbi:hypothetical protein QG37_07832 [Candidozyma auris]|nr:hypothetical protein QG37_07832 [[Candida] auris]
MGRLSRGHRADAVKIGKIKRFEEGKSRRTGEKGVFAQLSERKFYFRF